MSQVLSFGPTRLVGLSTKSGMLLKKKRRSLSGEETGNGQRVMSW